MSDGHRFNQAGFDPYEEPDQDLRVKFEADDHFTYLETFQSGIGNKLSFHDWRYKWREGCELEFVHTEPASA